MEDIARRIMVIISGYKKFEELMRELEEDMKNIFRVIDFLREKNGNVKLVLHPKSRSSEKASLEIGVKLKQIVKSIVFVDEKGSGVLVLARGDKKINEDKLEKVLHSKVKIANPKEVKKLTGYKVGSVSPFDQKIRVFVDEKIMELKEVQPAGGSTCVGALLSPKELLRLTQGKIIDVC